ncbi:MULTISPECIES: Asp23/Gls24 family envelope stress response protein [Thermomonospora]|uniref:Putative alkaline shock family protein YloU n=1 Tax=Thermomonospora cellulosilytica TaxID=1411118 RepID=A0A7W3N4X3_9ACTN|nr:MULTISPECIES: Asp23/Gls24 family envelope stress response protein [Thermomonospora]MBA9007629.1 putative alkaline shock family protein YloU [Thermomonospora cellulosilytica]
MSAGRLRSERGVTTIADRVVSKIVSRAAAEAERAGGLERSVLGVRLGEDRRVRARASASGGKVVARVELSVEYPASILSVTSQARERVRERVESLTGLTVDHVDIDVTDLTSRRPGKAVRVR